MFKMHDSGHSYIIAIHTTGETSSSKQNTKKYHWNVYSNELKQAIAYKLRHFYINTVVQVFI